MVKVNFYNEKDFQKDIVYVIVHLRIKEEKNNKEMFP